jgi:hypothetical protein
MKYFFSFVFFFLLPTEVQHKNFQRKQRKYEPKVLKWTIKLLNW